MGGSVAAFPMAQGGNGKPEAGGELLLRQPQSLTQACHVDFVRLVFVNSGLLAIGMGDRFGQPLFDALKCAIKESKGPGSQ